MEHCKSVALTATFITAGLFTNANPNTVYEAWGTGGIELHAKVVEYAQFIEGVYQILAENGSSPGVWDYDVSEPFGVWLRTQILASGDFEDLEDLAKPWLLQRIVEYWFSGNSPRIIGIHKKNLVEKLVAKGLLPAPSPAPHLESSPYVIPPESELETRLKNLEQRYEGFLVGLNENIARQVSLEIRRALVHTCPRKC